MSGTEEAADGVRGGIEMAFEQEMAAIQQADSSHLTILPGPGPGHRRI
jgi:hypothetical protein